jgi:hypothetical protein
MYLRLCAVRRRNVECVVTCAVVLRQLPFPSLKSSIGTLLLTLRKTTINFSQDNDLSNQQDATVFVYWSFYWSIWIFSTCFALQTRPSSGAFLTVYTALLQCTDIAADRWQGWNGTPVPSQNCHRSAAISVHCNQAVYTVKSAFEDGRVCRPKHVEQIQIDQ